MKAKNVESPEAIVVTQDLSLVHVATTAIPGSKPAWCQTFSSALTHVGPATKLLVVDASLDGPMASLLASLFVDHRPDRRVVVVSGSTGATMSPDHRITTLGLPVSWTALLGALHESANCLTQPTPRSAFLQQDASVAA